MYFNAITIREIIDLLPVRESHVRKTMPPFALLQTAPPALSAGDNAWILTSAALVLMMTGPGLALFYGGLVRRKNVLSTMMHSFIMMALVTVIWAFVGYSLVFSEGTPFVGGFKYLFLNGVGKEANPDYAATIPQSTFMIYQLMFAVITPALISGAYAERIRFRSMFLFTTLWTLVVYFPMAHMVWGKGGLLNAYLGGAIRTFDFAGGTVGACLLWVGWFGFNAGSALAASSLATSAFVATHFAAATAALGWLFAEWKHSGKPSMLGGISGAVAGLVAITPASGFVGPMPALLIGFLAGIFCFWMVTAVKRRFGYDDTLDAFGVHGAGGTLGALLTGVFATSLINDSPINGKVVPLGLIDGNPMQVLNQAIGVVIAITLAAVGTVAILKVCDLTLGLRPNHDDEEQGLDLSQHGEEGYILEA